jgi:hypothetical protein
VGLIAKDGQFYSLKQGMEVQIHGPSEADPLPSEETIIPRVPPLEATPGYVSWAPEPVAPKKALRMKYAVRVERGQAQQMSPETYRFAFLEKLIDLIEKEIYVPLPVILDRFFTAPHLASGNPRQIAEAMWRELKEVREPVRRVEEWLLKGELSAFAEELEITDPRGELSRENYDEEEILKELEELSLEDFLALL